MRRPLVISEHRQRSLRAISIAAALVCFVAVSAFMVPRHEPWADEAQAWQIARSVGFLDLFRTTIHYEGSPGLWHALLWGLVRLHVGYVGMHWLSALIALSGVCLVIFFAPFPLPLRLILPFTYFLVYQYSIIARSYVLVAPLLFGIAVLWPRRLERSIPLAILIALLANTCVHGIVIALGLFFVLLLEGKHDVRQIPRNRNILIAVLIAAAGIAFAVWCFLPPGDAMWVRQSSKLLKQPLPQIALLVPQRFHWVSALPPIAQIAIGMSWRLGHVLGFGVSNPDSLILIVWALLIVRWHREKRLRYLIPIVMLAGFCMVSRFDFYHAGLVWLLVLFLWWVTWPNETTGTPQRILVAFFALFLGIQAVWAARALHYDATHAYSPDVAAAPILRHYLDQGKLVDLAIPAPGTGLEGEYFAVGLEPYFATEPLHNAHARYWIWRPADAMRDQYLRDTQSRAVVVLLEQIRGNKVIADEAQRLTALGYRQTASVCGHVYYPRQNYPVFCHTFFERQ
jgi:hypothetical protein